MKILLMSFLILNYSFSSTLMIDSNGDYSIQGAEFNVVDLIRDYAKIKKSHLVMAKAPTGKLLLFGSRKITKKDIDLYISAALSEVGFTLIHDEKLNQVKVIESRDVRYDGGRLHNDISNVPDNYNNTMFSMKLKYVAASAISRNMRPFMSRYGRIIDDKNANTIILSDTGKNIKRLHQLITSMDTVQFESRVKFFKNLNDTDLVPTKTETSFLEFIKSQYVLLLIAFSLIGGIIGFGLRGYLMKRIEG